MNLTPDLLQYLIIFCISIPFLIPLFKKLSRIIPMIQIALVSSLLLSLFFAHQELPVSAVFGGWDNTRGVEILFDDHSFLFITATYIVFLSVNIYSFSRKWDWKYYFLLNLLLSDLTCLFVANDLFNIYVTLELLSLLSYLLISVEMKNRQIWSSLKYMILGAVGFNIYLLGVAMIYNESGTLNLSLLSQAGIKTPLPYLLVFTALMIKSGIFFYSMWLPSAHSEAETTISAILSAVIVKAGIFHLLRLGNVVGTEFISGYITTVGFISALSGAYLSIKQNDVKLIMAFSTMSQTGFVLIGWESYGANYAFSHAIFKALLFLSVGYLAHITGTRNITKRQKIQVPLPLFIALWVGYLSISGIPFFAGAFYKHEIIIHTSVFCQILLNIAALGSIISIGRIIFNIKPVKGTLPYTSRDLSLTLLAIGCLVIGIFSSSGHLSPKDLIEPCLLFLTGVVIYFLVGWKISFSYPYKLFKLTNVMTIYFIIIGLLAAMTYFVF